MKFSGIVSQLRNDELGAGSDLLFQFVILGHLLRFGCLEGRNDSSGEKIAGLMTDVTFDPRIRKPPVHVRYQLQGMDRIQVKDRGRSPLVTGYRVIAAHNQEVSDSCPIQGIKLAFDLTAVLVFAGKMDERLDAQLQNFAAHEIGRHGRGSTRIVCNGQGMRSFLRERPVWPEPGSFPGPLLLHLFPAPVPM